MNLTGKLKKILIFPLWITEDCSAQTLHRKKNDKVSGFLHKSKDLV